MENIKNKNLFSKILLSIIMIFSIFCLFACKTEPKILSRDATINDISIDMSQEISLNMNYIIIPQTDIKDLELTFKFYDSSRICLSTKVKNIGNVKEGIPYTVSISLTEFSFWDLFKIQSANVRVTNGTVSLI